MPAEGRSHAGQLCGESNTAAPEADPTVSAKLAELVARARKEVRLTNVVQYVDEELLRLAFRSLRKTAAPGVDGQSYEDYAAGLDENLWDLYRRLKSGRYRAPALRRVSIPKANGKLRPLGITTIEDRVVQKAVAWVLSAVFEQDFLECSQGFRPKRSAHMALRRLRDGMLQHWVRYVVERNGNTLPTSRATRPKSRSSERGTHWKVRRCRCLAGCGATANWTSSWFCPTGPARSSQRPGLTWIPPHSLKSAHRQRLAR